MQENVAPTEWKVMVCLIIVPWWAVHQCIIRLLQSFVNHEQSQSLDSLALKMLRISALNQVSKTIRDYLTSTNNSKYWRIKLTETVKCYTHCFKWDLWKIQVTYIPLRNSVSWANLVSCHLHEKHQFDDLKSQAEISRECRLYMV
jgi:hypothetical protein